MLDVVAPDPTLQATLDRFWERNEPYIEMVDTVCRSRQLPDVAGLPPQHTIGCGGQAVVMWHYWGEDEEMHEVTACSVCDRVYDYPRFA